MAAPDSFPLPGYPNYMQDPENTGRCPNEGNYYFWEDEPRFNADIFPDGPPGMGGDNDGTFARRLICTTCGIAYIVKAWTAGKFFARPHYSNPPQNDQVVVRTRVLLARNIIYNNAGLWIPALVTMTPESWVSGTPAQPDPQKIHLSYFVPGGYQADVIDNVTHLATAKVTVYWKEALNVTMGTGVGNWWFCEDE